MQVKISGVNLNIGSSLEEYIQSNLTTKVEKYFDRSISATVRIAKDAYLYKTSITVNEGVKCGIVINSNASSNDIYSSFDQALSKIAAQLRKYSSKLKSYHKRRAAKDKEKVAESLEMAAYNVKPQVEEQAAASEKEPEIISKSVLEIEDLTVDEAVMKLDLSDDNALVFTNKANGKVAFLYQKKDGRLVLLEV